MIKLLADKAEMEAIEKAEKKDMETVKTKPSSAVSQMSAPVVNDDASLDVPKSTRYNIRLLCFLWKTNYSPLP